MRKWDMELKNATEKEPHSIFSWVKDVKFCFIACTENLAELAGENSEVGIK